MTFILYFLTGTVAGIIGGLLGTGGCALIMPVVRFGFNFDPAFAVGTTLFAVVFTAGAGAYKHLKMGNVDRKTALYVGISGIFGVIIGSLVPDFINTLAYFMLEVVNLLWHDDNQGGYPCQELAHIVSS